MTINDLVNKIKDEYVDPYSILSTYSRYLKSDDNISTITIKQSVVTVKNFFEYCDIDVSPRKFKIKVRLPKVVKRNKEAISKEDVIEILNHCSDIRLKNICNATCSNWNACCRSTEYSCQRYRF